MIIVSVLLKSAIDGRTEELARMEICNMGTGTNQRGNYSAETLRGRSTADFAKRTRQRIAYVNNHPRLREHVWNLVAKCLRSLRYGDDSDHSAATNIVAQAAEISQLRTALDDATNWIENEETSTQGPAELAARDRLLARCHKQLEARP